MSTARGYRMISSGFGEAERLLEKYFIDPRKEKDRLRQSQSFVASIRNLLGEADDTTSQEEAPVSAEALEALELGTEFDSPDSLGTPLYEDDMDSLLGINSYLLGAEDDDTPDVITASQKPKVSPDEIRRRRNILSLLDMHESFFEHQAPRPAEALLKSLSQILTADSRGGGGQSLEDKLLMEQQRQQMRYGPGSAREGYQQRREVGESAEDEVDFSRKQQLQRERQRDNLERIKLSNKLSSQRTKERLASKQGLSEALRSDITQLKIKVSNGADVDKALATLNVYKDHVSTDIAALKADIDDMKIPLGTEGAATRLLVDLQKREQEIRQTENWMNNRRLDASIDPYGSLTPTQRADRIKRIDRKLADQTLDAETRKKLIESKELLMQ